MNAVLRVWVGRAGATYGAILVHVGHMLQATVNHVVLNRVLPATDADTRIVLRRVVLLTASLRYR